MNGHPDSRCRPGRRTGLALWFTLCLVTVFVLGGMILFNLMRGLTRQVEYADASIRAQYIGESAFHRLYARLTSAAWEDRWFAAGPDSGSQIELHGGRYDYFIADNPNRERHADIFVRSTYRNTRRCFYWLVEVKPGLLVGLAQGLPVGSNEIEPDRLPVAAGDNKPLADAMEKLITDRKAKRPIADAMEAAVKGNNDITQAIPALGGVSPADVVRAPGTPGGGGTPSVPPIIPPSPPVSISNGLDPSNGKTVTVEKEIDEDVIPVFVDYFDEYGTAITTNGDDMVAAVRQGKRYTPPPPPSSGGGGGSGNWGWWGDHHHHGYYGHRHHHH
ncbi:MAG: hypothetical protein GX442_14900 [Candidatus Riflebacteria bacterium]|nr:hypothetical protein [Candidatus Riflebacteria bacterium]